MTQLVFVKHIRFNWLLLTQNMPYSRFLEFKMKDSKIFKSKCAPWFNAVQVRNFSTLKNRHAEKVARNFSLLEK